MRISPTYKLADTMAGTPAKARALLEEVWAPARARALEERDALQALIAEEGGNFTPGALGLALLRRKAARSELYAFDEAAAEALFRAGQHDRGRLLHRRASCSAFPSANATTFPSIIPMCGCGK